MLCDILETFEVFSYKKKKHLNRTNNKKVRHDVCKHTKEGMCGALKWMIHSLFSSVHSDTTTLCFYIMLLEQNNDVNRQTRKILKSSSFPFLFGVNLIPKPLEKDVCNI